MVRRSFIAALLFLVFYAYAAAHVIHVPADYPKIQLAVNAAVNGDSVVVSSGTYFENVIFRGKKILLTSRYCETGDVSFISSTIINGSKPAFSDTASCVLIINGEDSTAVLQGFTLTGGTGTAWKDEHSPGTYREGGGVLVALSSPIIRNNLIINNEAVNTGGLASGGGGGMRCGDGSPRILNNVIMSNKGMYGGGIVLNYCDGVAIKNNIIYLNKVDKFKGGPTYGGGGIWINDKLSGIPHVIENNTLYLNFALDVGSEPAGAGAAILIWNGAAATIRNNIIWENHFVQTGAVAIYSSTVSITYNDIMETAPGTGNITVDPGLADSSFYLGSGSPCIDAGDPSASYNDIENSSSPGIAKSPSRGGVRNDIGAYGGKGALVFPNFNRSAIFVPLPSVSLGYVPPGETRSLTINYWSYGTKPLKVDSIRICGNVTSGISLSQSAPVELKPLAFDSIKVTWTTSQPITMLDTVLIYHNDSTQSNPARIPVTGKTYSIIPSQQGMMYAFSGSADGGKMYTVDTSNAKLSLQGPTDHSSVVSARINSVTKEIIALTSEATIQLIRVSSVGAQSLPISTISIANAKGMAFTSSGTLYLAAFNGVIYSVDINTGASTQMAATGLHLAGLAFNPINGSLWGTVRPVSTGKDNIYKINLATGAATFVGATGFGVTTKDITFDGKGRMFGVIDSGTAAQSYLISIDTTTGVGKKIGGMGVSGVETIELSSYYVTSLHAMHSPAPQEFYLGQNYPNPFNPTTYIRFAVPEAHQPSAEIVEFRFVSLKVFDTLGREVAMLVNEQKPAGIYDVQFDASKLASGVYLYRLQAGNFSDTKKMILMK